jgi:hypothetical protein
LTVIVRRLIVNLFVQLIIIVIICVLLKKRLLRGWRAFDRGSEIVWGVLGIRLFIVSQSLLVHFEERIPKSSDIYIDLGARNLS